MFYEFDSDCNNKVRNYLTVCEVIKRINRAELKCKVLFNDSESLVLIKGQESQRQAMEMTSFRAGKMSVKERPNKCYKVIML